MNVVLDIRGLSIHRMGLPHAPPIIDQISLTLHAGEVLGLIGESGAGKSTIGLSALGYTRPGCQITGGQILFEGRDLLKLDQAQLRALRGSGIAYIAQSAAQSFNPSLSLGTQICEASLRVAGADRASVTGYAIDLLGQLDVPDPAGFLNRYPFEVSGGQLQRAMAAMAMMTKPKIIVFDEPTTALDVTTQVEVLAAFRKLIRDHGTAALYITHDLAVVAQMADRIMVLRHGKMIEMGETDQILNRPQQTYTAALISERLPTLDDASPDIGAPLLNVEHLDAGYGPKIKILSDISLSICPNDVFAVVGESGSGKSTLARAIAGLIAPSAGLVRFEGQTLAASITRRPRNLARRIQYVFQLPDIALNPRHSVYETLARPLKFYFDLSPDQIKVRVFELLDQMELAPDIAQRLPGALSGGQKQRLCIARALAAKPDLIICDEITSALDQLVAEEILKLLQRLRIEFGLAYLFITHDLGLVARIANKVAVLQKGRMVAQGPLAETLVYGRDPYIDRLLTCVPQMRTDWLDEIEARRRISTTA